MKRIHLLFLLAVLHGFSFCLSAQEQDLKLLVKEATDDYEKGDYTYALQKSQVLLQTAGHRHDAALLAARCIHQLQYPADSLIPLRTLLTASHKKEAKYYLAKICHHEKKLDEAIVLLQSLNKGTLTGCLRSAEECSHLMEVCENAKQFMADPKHVTVVNLGDSINSKGADYATVFSADEQVLYFTSCRRMKTDYEIKNSGCKNEVVYGINKVKNNEKDTFYSLPINSEMVESCLAISPDGKQMLVYRNGGNAAAGDLLISRLDIDNTWQQPQSIGTEINSPFVETTACFGKDSNQIFFSSNRPGGYGGKDLYGIKKLPDGNWAKPYNLGPNINSKYDEDTPFFHANSEVLYFSSKGHNTMGEYDIFKSTCLGETNQFSKAENLGFPINNVGNDIYYVLNASGQRAYFSSAREGGFGGYDIFTVENTFEVGGMVVKPGVAYTDNEGNQVKITLWDNDGAFVNGIYNSNSRTGKFILLVDPLRSYRAIVEHTGYQPLVVDLDRVELDKVSGDLEFKLEKKAK
jgi:hypothetical protein